jgi:hypothetical protein
MRDSPLLQALCLAAALALAGVPVWSLTRPHAHVEPARISEPGKSATSRELVVTSTAEAEVELSLSGTVVWRGQPAANHFETTLFLPPDAELVALVRWARGEINAARFQVSRDGEVLTDATLWGGAEATDVLPAQSAATRQSTP